MISKELVGKINLLWHKQKTVGLTEEEKVEQKAARQEYLAGIRTQMREMLDQITQIPDHPKHENGCSRCNSMNHKH